MTEKVRPRRWYIATFLTGGGVRWHTDRSYATRREAVVAFGEAEYFYGMEIKGGHEIIRRGVTTLERDTNGMEP